jgi:hypothetical protein
LAGLLAASSCCLIMRRLCGVIKRLKQIVRNDEGEQPCSTDEGGIPGNNGHEWPKISANHDGWMGCFPSLVCIPLTEYPGVDFSNVHAVVLVFDEPDSGAIFLTDWELLLMDSLNEKGLL